MADDAIMQQVDMMDETASQSVTTKEDKQRLIEQLQGQLKSLKAMLPKKDIATVDHSSDHVNKEVTEHTISVKKTKKPEEDSLGIWEMCACESADCPSCQADKEATIAATVWLDSQTFTQTDSYSHMERSMSDEKTELEDKKERDGYERFPGVNLYDEMQQVSLRCDPSYYRTGHSTKFGIHLHPSLCVTRFDKFRGNPFASGIITLQFADKIIKANPETMYQWIDSASYLSDEVYEIVSSSLRDGNDIYMANYKGRSECLSSEDIILLNSHLDIKLIEEVTLDTVMTDTLAADIMNLERGQILLFIRMNDYNVWSAVRHHENSILIFDCQSHNYVNAYGEESVFGGLIYYLHRKPYVVIHALQLVEFYSGTFSGQCKIATIQT